MMKYTIMLSFLIVSAACSRAPSQKPASGPEPAAAPPQAALPVTRLAFPDGASITVEVADTPGAGKSLMFRRAIPRIRDALRLPRTDASFWMKNTLVSLDMIWLDGERRVTGVHPDVPASREDAPEAELARRTGTGKFVLELAAGEAARRGLKPGARLEFSWKDAPL